jgi:hypothetical protein
MAVNPALLAPAATVTVAGSVTAVLLLVRLTLNPPLDAAEVRVTVQASSTHPVVEAGVHVIALKAGVVAL